MALSLEGTQALFRLGHHAAIVEQAGSSHEALRSVAPELRLLVAHALFHVGDTQRAAAIVERDNQAAAPAKLRSYCELLTGLLKRRSGLLSDSQIHFQAAYLLARE